MSTNNNDWRLTNQMNYLYQKKLDLKPYQPYRKGWEHEHCAFCEKTIDVDSPDAYATEDNYHWICKECFNDFKKMFKWKVD